MDHLAKAGFDRLLESERILATVWQFAAGVANHGFAGYYLSRRGDLAFHAPAALGTIGAAELASIAAEANALFGAAGPSRDPKARAEQVRRLMADGRRVFDELETRYFDSEEDIDELFEAWFLRNHPQAAA